MERAKPLRMSREAFRRWVEDQGGKRFERVAGEPVAMAPERIEHVRLKTRIWQALDRALSAKGGNCEALGDGVTVEIDDDIDYEPDVLVNCGDRLAGDTLAADNPVIVVEVLSPSTKGADTGAKLTDYFSVQSIVHYLIFRADRAVVVHHRREGEGYHTRILNGGALELTPPGIEIDLDEIFRQAGVGSK
jgi:Uma2 family endonuclease